MHQMALSQPQSTRSADLALRGRQAGWQCSTEVHGGLFPQLLIDPSPTCTGSLFLGSRMSATWSILSLGWVSCKVSKDQTRSRHMLPQECCLTSKCEQRCNCTVARDSESDCHSLYRPSAAENNLHLQKRACICSYKTSMSA